MSTTIAGRTVIITGAASGIGEATTLELAAAGARLELVDQQRERLDVTTERAQAAGASTRGHVLDVGDHHAVDQLVADVLRQHDRVDAAVLCAGVGDQTAIPDGDPDHWARLLRTNVLGVMYLARALLGPMLRQDAGDLVVIASVSGRVTYVGEPAYIASKHAVVALIDCLRQEVAASGVRVILINPGLVDTPMLHGNPFAEQLRDQVTPLDPADCARAIRFALEQPPNCAINELVLRPTRQTV